jgi:hypothetical protein
VPLKTVLCTPSKSTEAWVVAALFPQDLAVERGIECWPNPEGRLGQQPLGHRISKRRDEYESRATDFSEAWPRLAQTLDEARRFDADFRAALR